MGEVFASIFISGNYYSANTIWPKRLVAVKVSITHKTVKYVITDLPPGRVPGHHLSISTYIKDFRVTIGFSSETSTLYYKAYKDCTLGKKKKKKRSDFLMWRTLLTI